MLIQWYKHRLLSWRARHAWNRGVPMVSMSTARNASEAFAPYWTQWAGQLNMTCSLQYSPVSTLLSAIVNKEFWIAVMQTHGLKTDRSYWHDLISRAAMEGNLSVVEAFSEVFDVAAALAEIQASSFVHPRVIQWQLLHGDKDQVFKDAFTKLLNSKECSAWDAQHFVWGGPALQEWVLDWVKLPDTVINECEGYAIVQVLQNMLTFMQADPGERDVGSKMPTLREGHQYRKCRAPVHVSDLAAPLFADTILTMLKAVYSRFDFEAPLMDAVCGRSTLSDMDDARVCAVVNIQVNQIIVRPDWWPIEQRHKVEEHALTESVLSHVLQWHVEDLDSFSVVHSFSFSFYAAALPFFRRAAPQQAVTESFDVCALL